MAELKTRPNNNSVIDFLNDIQQPGRKEDGFELLKLFTEETNEPPVLWGPSIIGFGKFQYKYKSGREEIWFPVGFSPRKQALSLYLMKSFSEFEDSLRILGNHRISKGCLYIKRLSEVNESVLRQMIRKCYTDIMEKDQK